MDCKWIEEKLSAYMDDHLAPEERETIDHHLKTCRKCRAALHDLRQTVEYARGVEEMEPPAWLAQKVMAQLREEPGKRGIVQKLFYPLHIKIPAEIFATIAIAVVTVYIFKTIQPVMKRAEMPKQEVTALLKEERKRAAPEEETPASPGMVSHSAKSRMEESASETPAVPAAKAKMNETVSGESFVSDMNKPGRLGAPAPEPARISKQMKQATTLTVYVKDIESARHDVEKSVKILGGHILEADSTPHSFIYVSTIDSRKINDLKNELSRIGKFEAKLSDYAPQVTVTIKIELLELGSN